MLTNWIIALAVAALVLLLVVRRARRLFVRQRFSVPRIVFRLFLIGTVTTMLFVVLSLAQSWIPAAALTAGAALGLFGAALTRFDTEDGALYYTPNLYIGLGVFALFLGRLTYRLIRLIRLEHFQTAGGFEHLQRSPITVALLFVLFGYFFFHQAAVLVRGSTLRERSAVRG